MVGGALTKDDSTCFAVGYLVHEAEREREMELERQLYHHDGDTIANVEYRWHHRWTENSKHFSTTDIAYQRQFNLTRGRFCKDNFKRKLIQR